MNLLTLRCSRPSDTNQYNLSVQTWSSSRGHGPKLRGTPQALTVSPEILKLYIAIQQETGDMSLPKFNISAPVQMSGDASLLRIGSAIYSRNKDKDDIFEEITLSESFMDYIEEFSSHGDFFAIASRSRLTGPTTAEEEEKSNHTKAENGGNASDKETTTSKSKTSAESDSDSDSDSSSESDSDSSSRGGHSKSDKPQFGSEDSMSIKSHLSEMRDEFGLKDFDASDASSMSANSARESWSEASTAAGSDEIDNEEVWNDFASDDELIIEDDANSLFSDGGGGYDKDLEDLSDTDSGKSASSLASLKGKATNMATPYSVNSDSSNSSQASTSSYSDSYESDSDENDAGQKFDELVSRPSQTSSEGQTSELRIFKMSQQDGQGANRVFRFRYPSEGRLYASPPVFHPTRELLVWPVGPGEILFANFTQNTYFTRRIFTASKMTCQISVQCQFSPDGCYLHMASLDGFLVEPDGIKGLALKLRISTYRLSSKKTTRAPPKLVFQTAINLSPDFMRRNLSVSSLPYTLTWTDSYVYVTESRPCLRVYRVPLYQAVREADKTEDSPKAVFTNSGDIFLPRSAAGRKVYFFPETDPGKEKKSKSKPDKERYVATAIIAAQKCSTGLFSTADSVSDACIERTPPQGIHLTASNMGHWESAEGHRGDIKGLKRAETWKGGQLLAKYEKFDRSEDCDIVPYLQR